MDGFSKKLPHPNAAVNLYMAWYNSADIHGSLSVAPSIEAGITDQIWTTHEKQLAE